MCAAVRSSWRISSANWRSRKGETTEDREFSIERVACVGCCALAPVALVGETLHGHMAPSKVEGLVLRVRLEKEKAEREPNHDRSQYHRQCGVRFCTPPSLGLASLDLGFFAKEVADPE
jgi:hypothetical protein